MAKTADIRRLEGRSGPAATEVASFRVEYRRYIDASGDAVAPLPAALAEPERLKALYRGMVMTRLFDEKAIALQRTGRLGTFASSLGQEGVVIGTTAAMRDSDVLLPSFREQGAQLNRGVTLTELLLFWGGDERGSVFSGPREDFPASVPVGTHYPHAAGVAAAFQMRGEARAAVAIGGDGSTSKGDFYESLNIAGTWKLPAVFVINNNQWAISAGRSVQSAAETLAQKGIAAGIPCEQVDGNDVVAVCDSVGRALERAYSGDGATLIEAVTYRLSDHTTADDARRYRSDEEVSARWREEPIGRLRKYMSAQGIWDRAEEDDLRRACTAEIEAAVDAYLAIPAPPLTDMIDYLFATLPKALLRQRQELADRSDGDG